MGEEDPYRVPATAFQPAAVESVGGSFYYQKEPHGLTRFVVIMLCLNIAVLLVAILFEGLQLAMILREEMLDAVWEANYNRQRAIGIIYLLIYVVTAVPFGMWIYRANENSRGFGAEGMKFSAGWSVGWYFIPIANLFMPFRSMREIWQISRNPHGWRSFPVGRLVSCWWALWLGSSLLGQVLRFWPQLNARDWTVTTVGYILLDVVLITLAVMAIKLLRQIVANQDILVGGNRGVPSPAPAVQPPGADSGPRTLRERSLDSSDPY